MRFLKGLILLPVAVALLQPTAEASPKHSKKPDYRYKVPKMKYKKPKIKQKNHNHQS